MSARPPSAAAPPGATAGGSWRPYKRADGGPHDPAPWSYRVEAVVCCPRHGDMLAFHRLTLPGFEHEGVSYDRGSVGKSATLTPDGPGWRRVYVGCTHCRYRVPISRRRLEAELAAMWAPYATRREAKVWDS